MTPISRLWCTPTAWPSAELEGHVKLLELTIWDIVIEDAGAGEKAAQKRIERHIRDVLASYRGKRA